MLTSTKALIIGTTASLIGVASATITNGGQVTIWVMWACWLVLAVATAATVVADRRRT